MKKLVTSNQTFGPFNTINVVDGGYKADGAMFPETVIGPASIVDWTGPLPQPSPGTSPVIRGRQPRNPRLVAKNNKQTASELLAETDWTQVSDVSNPEVASPYLTNAAEFAQYRSQVRAIAVNPPSTPAEFPVKPEAVWSEPN